MNDNYEAVVAVHVGENSLELRRAMARYASQFLSEDLITCDDEGSYEWVIIGDGVRAHFDLNGIDYDVEHITVETFFQLKQNDFKTIFVDKEKDVNLDFCISKKEVHTLRGVLHFLYDINSVMFSEWVLDHIRELEKVVKRFD